MRFIIAIAIFGAYFLGIYTHSTYAHIWKMKFKMMKEWKDQEVEEKKSVIKDNEKLRRIVNERR